MIDYIKILKIVLKEINNTIRKCTLNNTNFTNTNLHHTKFHDMKFKKANFTEAELTYAFFENCICEDLKCIETSFQYAKLINCTFKNCDFNKASLAYAKLKGVTGENLKCIKMYCPNLNVDECKFNNTNFKLSTITDGDIHNSSFNNVCFESDILPKCINSESNKSKHSSTVLKSTVFENILFKNTTFENTNCSNNTIHNCNFINCNCKNTNFQNSKMDNIYFNRSDLENASFMNSTITKLTLDKTITDNVDWGKEDVSETINIAEFANKDDTPIQPKTPNQAGLPINALQSDVEKLMQSIINDLTSVAKNNDEALLKVYSKQITNMKNIIDRIKNDNKLPDDIKDTTLDFISDMAAIFEYRKIGLASKLSIELTLKERLRKPCDCTDKIKPSNIFTDEYYGFYISPLNAEHMVKAYKNIHGTDKLTDWSIADIMVNCLDITEVNFTTYTAILINFINNLERCECDGFIIKATKDKPPIINKDKLIKICKTRYGLYLPTDFDYNNNIVLFRGRYKI